MVAKKKKKPQTAILNERLWVPAGHVDRSITSEFTYTFKRKEDVRVEDDSGYFSHYEYRFFDEVHEMFVREGRMFGFHRGNIERLKKFFGHLKWKDERTSIPMGAALAHKEGISYRHDQEKCIQSMLKTDGGGLQIAPTGWGKTFFGISMAIETGQRTLVLASRTNWLDDWMKDLRKHTNMEELEEEYGGPVCGIIKNSVREEDLFPCINFCTFSAFYTHIAEHQRERLKNSFGMVIADEASQLPAKEVSAAFTAFNPKWRVALTADEKRADRLHKLTYDIVGPIISRGKRRDNLTGKVIRENSGITLNAARFYGNWLGTLQSKISKNKQFSELVIRRAIEDVAAGYKVMIITKTKAQVAYISQRLATEEYPVRQRNKKTGKTRTVYREIQVAVLQGGKSKRDNYKNDEVKKQARAGEVDVLVCTPIVELNTDIDRMDCLHDMMPVGNEQAIRQRWGRVGREHPDKKTPRIRIWDFKAGPDHHPAAKFLVKAWALKEEWALRHGYQISDYTPRGSLERLDARIRSKEGSDKRVEQSFIRRKKDY